MSFCPQCGRQRGAGSRFCGNCGKDFGQPAADGDIGSAAGPVAEVPPAGVPLAADAGVPLAAPAGVPPVADATRAEPVPAAGPDEPAAFGPAEPTRWDVLAGPTRLDGPLDTGQPDRYSSWYTEPSPAGEVTAAEAPPAGGWEAADTAYAAPAHAAGYAPPPPPVPAYLPPAPPGGEGRPSGGRGTAILIIVVVLVVLGAGGGAYALTRSHGPATAQPPSEPTVTAPPSTAPQAATVPASPVVNASASPTASPSPSVTPSPTRTGTVRVAPGVASNPAEPRVVAYLNRYFSAINTRNYDVYQSLLDAQEQQDNTRSSFDSGYATTKDSNEVLTGIQDAGGGSVTATVSFTSRQSPGDSVDSSACNNWQLSYNLAPQGSSYVLTAAQSSYTDC